MLLLFSRTREISTSLSPPQVIDGLSRLTVPEAIREQARRWLEEAPELRASVEQACGADRDRALASLIRRAEGQIRRPAPALPRPGFRQEGASGFVMPYRPPRASFTSLDVRIAGRALGQGPGAHIHVRIFPTWASVARTLLIPLCIAVPVGFLIAYRGMASLGISWRDWDDESFAKFGLIVGAVLLASYLLVVAGFWFWAGPAEKHVRSLVREIERDRHGGA